jgi:Na+/melibiose symporter-like transporter
MDGWETIGTTVAVLVVYFAPTMIATRSSEQGQLFLFNLAAGWTVIGWVIALVWALMAEPPEE